MRAVLADDPVEPNNEKKTVKGRNAAVAGCSNQNGVVLLVLCTPNLHHRERLISYRDTAQIELGA